MLNVHARVAAARQRLVLAGIPDNEAALDARILAEFVLGWDAARFFTAAADVDPPGFAKRYGALVARREAREPLAYVIGRQEFWELQFEVSPAVLIPRPETELLVETALELFSDGSVKGLHYDGDHRRGEALQVGRHVKDIADIGTGSGCLAVALSIEYPSARVVATEISKDALAIAERNAVRHGVADRVQMVRTDLLDGVAEPFDLIISNPPYVPERDRDTLQPEVRDHEPAAALFAGEDGLDVIRSLVTEVPNHLPPGGTLVFEFGFGQADAVTKLISGAPRLTMVGLRHDLQGIPRVAIARRESTVDS